MLGRNVRRTVKTVERLLKYKSIVSTTDEDEEVPANIVEGDSDILETEIIQGYHGNKDNKERT